MEQDMPVQEKRLWPRILLGASLALNLLVIGLAVGAALRFGGPDGARRPPPMLTATLYRELPHEDRQAIRDTMSDIPNDRGPGRKAVARQFAAALRAEPLDVAALETLLSEHALRRGDWQARANVVLLEQVEKMSAQERASYADRVEASLSRKGRHSKDGRQKHD